MPLEELADLALVGGVVGSITSLQPQFHGLKAERPRQYVGIPTAGTTQPSQLKQGLETTSNLEPAGGFVDKATFTARALTSTRRAGGLSFRPAAEKTKAHQRLQRYVCESKQFRGARRAHSAPQSARGGRDGAQRANRPFYKFTFQTPCSARERISC